ncbi:DNA/RNA polymerase [Thermothelomyces heterothallicus CBS 203.75]
MNPAPSEKAPPRRDSRVIIHFDLDCFYAQCVENRQPSLKSRPLGIKQKGILATCNYVARRHGVRKLMPIAQAKKVCPDLVLADGEDLSPFRDVSKRLYALLRSYSWNGKVERLGLDEMFLDVTDMVSYNLELLNRNALPRSYFCLSRSDPEVGFEYDATSFAGCVHGNSSSSGGGGGSIGDGDDAVRPHESVLYMRLLVASHLAFYLRLKIEEQGYTTSCGISTSKLLAKLVGNRNKPRNQTTLLALCQEDVQSFMDEHSLRKVPGIGGRITRLLEGFVLGREPDPDTHTMECSTTVGQVRTHPGISPSSLSRLLSGRGLEKNLGRKVWALLHGVDDSEVQPARDIPTQISIEDTYRGLSSLSEIRRALLAVTVSLVRRMHADLLEGEDEDVVDGDDNKPPDRAAASATPSSRRRWLARPRTLRLTTRPYTAPQDEKPYNWGRVSRSCPLPSFVFNTSLPREERAARLVNETLLPLFHKLYPPPPPPPPPPTAVARAGTGPSAPGPPEPGGWNIGLLNVCVTNMSAGAVDGGGGGDIGQLFRRQQGGLLSRGSPADGPPAAGAGHTAGGNGSLEEELTREEGGDGESAVAPREWNVFSGDNVEEEEEDEDMWDSDEDTRPDEDSALCPLCDRLLPRFAMSAHERYHSLGDA